MVVLGHFWGHEMFKIAKNVHCMLTTLINSDMKPRGTRSARRSESFYRKLFTHSKNNFGQKTILYTWWSNIIFLGCRGSNSNRLLRSILGGRAGFIGQTMVTVVQWSLMSLQSWSKVWWLRWNKEYFVRTCWTKYPLLQHIPIAKFIPKVIGQELGEFHDPFELQFLFLSMSDG